MPVSRLLLVEINSADARLVQEWLKPMGHWKVKCVKCLADAVKELESVSWDIVLLDMSLLDPIGLDAINRVRSLAHSSGLIVLTAASDVETAITSLKLGADDCLIKPCMDGEVLKKSIRYVAHKKQAEKAATSLRDQHHQFERALDQEFKKFQSLFENALDGIVMADDSQRFLDANPAACAIFGLSREELLKKKITDFVSAAAVPETLGTWDEFRSSKSQRGAIQILTAHGASRILEYSASADSLPGQHMSILRDVTEARAIKEERDRFFSVALDMICVADMKGRFQLMNPACQTILGYSPEEMCSRPILDFIHPDDVAATAEKITEVVDGKMVLLFENRYRAKNGSYVHLAWKSVTIGDRVYATARDITERNRLQAQLLHADRMVAVGTLAAGVAHEINNPLAFTLTNLQLVMDELNATEAALNKEKVSEVREMLDLAVVGANRVRDIVSGLKLFSRNDDEQIGSLRVESVLESSIRMAQHEIHPRAMLEKKFGQTPLVRGNEGRLGQVFLNILINAAQSISEGSADDNKIVVSTGTDSVGNAYIAIEDTGCGIPSGIVDRIFDPFFTTKPVGTGTGLGLSVCHGIITALKGSIAIESGSKEGRGGERGTLIRVTLPPSDSPEREIVTEDKQTEVRGKRLRIAVIDDEEIFAMTITTAIKKHHDVTMFTDSSEAFKQISSGSGFDFILCDLMMPGLTGMDIYERLIDLKGHDFHNKLIFMTGGAFTPRSIQFLQNAEIKRIEKPFRIQDILERLKAS